MGLDVARMVLLVCSVLNFVCAVSQWRRGNYVFANILVLFGFFNILLRAHLSW